MKDNKYAKWIVTYAGYNEPDGYPVYKQICPYCRSEGGGNYCSNCGHRIIGQIPDDTVADCFKPIFTKYKDYGYSKEENNNG